MAKEINNKILKLKKDIRDLEKIKNKGSFKEKVKKTAKALRQSTNTVFSALGQAGGDVLGDINKATRFADVDDVIKRMPQ